MTGHVAYDRDGNEITLGTMVMSEDSVPVMYGIVSALTFKKTGTFVNIAGQLGIISTEHVKKVEASAFETVLYGVMADHDVFLEVNELHVVAERLIEALEEDSQ